MPGLTGFDSRFSGFVSMPGLVNTARSERNPSGDKNQFSRQYKWQRLQLRLSCLI